MNTSFRFWWNSIRAIPLLPLLIKDGRYVKRTIPRLPEASGPQGIATWPTSTTKTLLTIGESTVAGVGVATHERGLTGTLAACLAKNWQCPVQWRVYAKSGYTARQVTAALLPEIEERQVDLIVIGLGGNDTFAMRSPKSWKKDIQALLEQLRQLYPATPIHFLDMPPVGNFPAFTWSMRSVLGRHARLLGDALAELLPHYPLTSFANQSFSLETWQSRYKVGNDPKLFFSDGLHPSELTYQLWAKDTARVILAPNQSVGLIHPLPLRCP